MRGFHNLKKRDKIEEFHDKIELNLKNQFNERKDLLKVYDTIEKELNSIDKDENELRKDTEIFKKKISKIKEIVSKDFSKNLKLENPDQNQVHKDCCLAVKRIYAVASKLKRDKNNFKVFYLNQRGKSFPLKDIVITDYESEGQSYKTFYFNEDKKLRSLILNQKFESNKKDHQLESILKFMKNHEKGEKISDTNVLDYSSDERNFTKDYILKAAYFFYSKKKILDNIVFLKDYSSKSFSVSIK